MSVKKEIDFDKLLTLSREMDLEVKQFLIVSHTEEEKSSRTEELNEKYEYLKTNLKPVFNMIIGGNMDMMIRVIRYIGKILLVIGRNMNMMIRVICYILKILMRNGRNMNMINMVIWYIKKTLMVK